MTLQKKPLFSLRSATGRSFFHFRVSKRFAKRSVLVSISLTVIGSLFGGWVFGRQNSLRGHLAHEFDLADGPWGHIHARPVLLHPPAEIFDPEFQLGDGCWYFQKASPSAIGSILRDCGLTENQIAPVLSTLLPVSNAPVLVSAKPPPDIVMELDAETRSRLYEHLARIEVNFAQCQPFRMAASHLEKWFDGADLDPEILARVRKLLWRSGDTLMFSDYNLVAPHIRNPEERVELQRTLSRKVALRASLQISPDEKIDDIAEYWSAEGRGENGSSILKSASEYGGASIDLIELLPPFARAHLNRFPDVGSFGETPPACHWSTFNFFINGETNPAFHTAAGVEKEIQENYVLVDSKPRFGDIVLLNEPDGSTIHSAVFIADDMVFTKNGPSAATPWVLSTIGEMKAFYPVGKALSVVFRRHKPHRG